MINTPIDSDIDVVHGVGDCLPHATGGTEVYVHRLCAVLDRRHIRSVIIVPEVDAANTAPTRETSYRNQRIIAYSNAAAGCGGDSNLRTLLKRFPQALYHQHGWQPDLGLNALTVANELNMPSVITLHTSSSYCLRNDFMRFGATACEDDFDVSLCAACVARRAGLTPKLSRLAAAIPEAASGKLGALIPGRLGTAAGLRARAGQHRAAFAALLNLTAAIIVPARWQFKMLRVRGVPRSQLHWIKHGVDVDVGAGGGVQRQRIRDQLHCVYVGRIAPEKGLDHLLEVWRRLPQDLEIVLHIVGTARSPGGRACAERIALAQASNLRVRYHGGVEPDDVVRRLRETADVVLVPSQVMETGPQVVIEAFAAGVPVIGSALGGIADWVTNDVNGRLLAPRDTAAWVETLVAAHDCPAGLSAWRRMVRRPPSMSDVARQMAAVYAQVKAQSTKDRAGVAIESLYHYSSIQRQPFPT